MRPIIPINFLSYQMEAGKNRAGSKLKRGRERKRKADKGSRRWSVGENQKWYGLRNDRWKRHLSFSNRRNKTSINEDINIFGGGLSFAGLLCRDFCSPL
jgi:hypothetical protein